MAICETCGTRWQPSPEAPGCPRCTPARPARRAPVAAGADAPRPSAPRAAAPGPAAARPAAPRRAAPAPEPPPQHHASRRGSHSGAHAAHESEDAQEVRLDPAVKIGFIIAAVFLVVTLVVVFTVKSKKDEERRIATAHEQALSDLHTQLMTLNVASDEGATQILKLGEDKRSVWTGSDIASDVVSLMGKAAQSLENAKERRTVIDRFATIKKDLADTSKLSPERARAIKVELEELETRASVAGPEFVTEVTGARATAERVCNERLLADAQSTAAANADKPRIALRKSILAEEALQDSLNRAVREKRQEDKVYYEPLYKASVELTDDLANQVFSGDTESVAWKDMLAGDAAKAWGIPTGTAGFSAAVQNGVLQIIGPDAGSTKQAVLSIGDREQWRNFVLDIEFTVEKGNLEILFRLGKSMTPSTPGFRLATEGESKSAEPGKVVLESGKSYIEAGKKYRAKVSVLGSKVIFRFVEGSADTEEMELKWTNTRKGAIGLLIPPGTRMNVTGFRVRELQ